MPRGDVMTSLHNVEHINKRVFFLLSVRNTGHYAQVIIPLLCATGNTSTAFEGTITYSIIRLCFKCEMTVRKLHHPHLNTASTSNQNHLSK